MSHVRSLVALATLASVSVLACASGTGAEGDAGAPPTPTVEAGTPAPAATDFQLRSDMRAAWLATTQWTHLYAIAALANAPDEPQALDRLTQSEDAIGTEASPILGNAQSDDLSALLRARAADARAFMRALESRDPATTATAKGAWDQSTNDLAAFFGRLGDARSTATLATALRANETAMQGVVTARANGDLHAEIAADDEAERQSLAVGDAFTDELLALGSSQVAPSALSPQDRSLRLELRPLLARGAFWLRVVAIEQLRGEPLQPVLDQAIAVRVATANVFARFYGNSIGGQVEFWLHSELADAYAYMLATKSADPTASDATRQIFVTDMGHFARYLASVDASWRAGDLDRILQVGVDRTLGEYDARVAAQWDADAADYQLILDNSRELGDLLADGLASAFPRRPR